MALSCDRQAVRRNQRTAKRSEIAFLAHRYPFTRPDGPALRRLVAPFLWGGSCSIGWLHLLTESKANTQMSSVPIWRESLMANPTLLATCPSAENVSLPFLTESGSSPFNHQWANRHHRQINMVTNRGYDVCPALQDGLPVQRKGGKITAAGLLSMMTRVATEDVTCCAGHWGHWAKFSVPCPNIGSGLDIDETLALRAAAHSQLPRSVLAMGSFGMHGKQAHLRASWRAECINLPDECDFVDLGCLPNSQSATWLCAANSSGVVPKDPLTGWKRISSARLNATFCLEPFGDSHTQGVSDTLLLGCIPVLSHEDQTKVWPWHTGSQWRDSQSCTQSQPGSSHS